MSELDFTHLDKVFFPKTGYTKGDLIAYYQSVADVMLPYLKDRPHSLKRQPDGIKGESFFQKNVDDMPPDWVKTIKVHSESTNEDIHYLVVTNQDSFLYMVQLGCIEINPWNSRVGHLEKPDWLILDLDPEAAGFDKVVETARAIYQVCQATKIAAIPKTSGKRGLHIFIPLGAEYSYKQARDFGKMLATRVNQKLPEITSLERHPAKRRGKVYIDYLQNGHGQTLAAPYSARPTEVASVSTPLHWDEVKIGLDPQKFTIKNTRQRLNRVGDLWKPVLGKGIDLKAVLNKVSK